MTTEDVSVTPIGATAFTWAAPRLLTVYEAAMAPPPDQLPAREAVMRHHATLAGFHAVVAHEPGSPDASDAVAFAYGFPGRPGQWWHDIVTAEVAQRDPAALRPWFGSVFEIAEVHVRPEWQGRGLGRSMLSRLTTSRTEATAALSTRPGPTPARRLYHSFGFVDLLPRFFFPGAPDQPFAVMVSRLPLRSTS
ncbi:GNAT family N-acetyltransferase [Spiractinospora alimapuensis]|uniref:GNAT family N-acetyltransferase n=1 Tax=Spiractinospora alimapuensis TaxID=2820884 RepID=UPI001F2D3BA1|nr:GNAT family N-acetyltransferase [Spiractinospora alimapuensis]